MVYANRISYTIAIKSLLSLNLAFIPSHNIAYKRLLGIVVVLACLTAAAGTVFWRGPQFILSGYETHLQRAFRKR